MSTKNVSVVEKSIGPEKAYTDSFMTEDSDGHKISVTRNIVSRRVKRIIYSDGVGNMQLGTYKKKIVT